MNRDINSMHLKVDSISRDYDSFKSNQMNENAEYAIHVQSNFDLLNSTLTKIKERDPLTARIWPFVRLKHKQDSKLFQGSLIKDKHSYLEKFVINEVKSGKFRGPVGPSGPAGHPGPAGVKGEPGTKGETGDILSVKVKMILFADQSDYSV